MITLGSIIKGKSFPESQTDYFEFPKKNSAKQQSCLETTSLSPVANCSKNSLDLKQQKNEITENETISNNTCSKYVRVSNLFNDSSLLFQTNTSSLNKNNENYNNTEPIIVKALSKNLCSIKDCENEIKTSSQGDVAIPNMILNDCASKSDPKLKESALSSLPETIQQCPICLKTVSKYVSHMKSCAAKNKLNTQQLLSALKLHQKQLAERKELGLNVPVQSFRAKVSPKRSKANDKKVGSSHLNNYLFNFICCR